jgi:SAM-dependent methyltransferase
MNRNCAAADLFAAGMSLTPVGYARWGSRRVRQLLHDALLSASELDDNDAFRGGVARRFLRGDGIEIGALHRPMRVPRSARVRYVDVMSRQELLAIHSGPLYVNPSWVREPDVVDDGERLASFADASVDFVIANHMLEHAEDPIGALGNFARVLRPGGVMFIALPDARRTFDALRERTSVEHLLRDHSLGPGVSRAMHYREWAFVECLPQELVAERVACFEREKARHHFHVWELDGFLDLSRAISLPVSLEFAATHSNEFVTVFRRCHD